MRSGPPVPTLVVSAPADEVMHVEQSATPDGRLLLYFTFESAETADRQASAETTGAPAGPPSGAAGALPVAQGDAAGADNHAPGVSPTSAGS